MKNPWRNDCMHFFTDFLRIVSCWARDSGASLRQETSRKSFLSGVGQRGFIATGNCLRMVSYSTWDKGDSWRQETICEWFPTRRGTKGIHSDRKLFAYSFLSGMGRWQIIVAGNCTRMVSYSTWEMGIHSDRKLFANGFLLDVGQWGFIAAGNCLRMVFHSAWGSGIS